MLPGQKNAGQISQRDLLKVCGAGVAFGGLPASAGGASQSPADGRDGIRGDIMTNISGPDFITLLVSDLEVSYRFYTEKIGLNESSEKRPNAYAFKTEPRGLAIRQSSDRRKTDHPGRNHSPVAIVRCKRLT